MISLVKDIDNYGNLALNSPFSVDKCEAFRNEMFSLIVMVWIALNQFGILSFFMCIENL